MRLKIFDHIRCNQTSTVGELSRVLGVTGANIRHHLAILESNELVEIVGQRKDGRGRPMNLYGLSRRMLGDTLDELAGGLLATCSAESDHRAQQARLRSVAEKLAGANNDEKESSIPRRLTRAIDRLNELHYRARWEAGAAGPRLILCHCPYAAIILNHPELCQMDAYLLETQLGLLVDQTEKLQLSAKGLPFCAFLVKEKH